MSVLKATIYHMENVKNAITLANNVKEAAAVIV